jgi:hypothetical protein
LVAIFFQNKKNQPVKNYKVFTCFVNAALGTLTVSNIVSAEDNLVGGLLSGGLHGSSLIVRSIHPLTPPLLCMHAFHLYNSWLRCLSPPHRPLQ